MLDPNISVPMIVCYYLAMCATVTARAHTCANGERSLVCRSVSHLLVVAPPLYNGNPALNPSSIVTRKIDLAIRFESST